MKCYKSTVSRQNRITQFFSETDFITVLDRYDHPA